MAKIAIALLQNNLAKHKGAKSRQGCRRYDA
jgi:hypothetical protein